MYDGVKVAESWTRSISNHTNGSGHGQNCAISISKGTKATVLAAQH